jgi:hypothetical protein
MINEMMTGFFTGVGVVSATWFYNKYIRHRLDKADAHLKKGIDFMKGEQK